MPLTNVAPPAVNRTKLSFLLRCPRGRLGRVHPREPNIEKHWSHNSARRGLDLRRAKRGILSQDHLWTFARDCSSPCNCAHREWPQQCVCGDQRALREKEWSFWKRKVDGVVCKSPTNTAWDQQWSENIGASRAILVCVNMLAGFTINREGYRCK